LAADLSINVAKTFALRAPHSISVSAASAPRIDEIATLYGAGRIVIVTSNSLGKGPLVGSISAALGHRLAAVYSKVRSHSPSDCVVDCVGMANEAQADLIIAIGGGSVIDAAKVIRLCLLSGINDVAGYERLAGGQPIGEVPTTPRLIVVPTTLSAAEFTPLAGITNAKTGHKDIFSNTVLIPNAVIMDPQALAGTPPDIIATTGIRAVDHCIEGYCSPAANPYHDALAVEGLRLLLRHLPMIVRAPQSLDVFSNLQMAAWMAVSGPAAGVALGASHGIGRVLGGVSGIAHGHTSAILLPAVLRWNTVCAESLDRQQSLLNTLGSTDSSLAELVDAIVRDLALPSRLSDVGVDRADMRRIARESLAMLSHPSVCGNARSVGTEHDVMEILEHAW
jgi:maleylacetate reductase